MRNLRNSRLCEDGTCGVRSSSESSLTYLIDSTIDTCFCGPCKWQVRFAYDENGIAERGSLMVATAFDN